MTWKTDLRAHDGRLSDRLFTPQASEAVAHFRRLLAREDLIGKPVAARLVSPITGQAIYFSRFDRGLGDGRIHPDAPLDVMRTDDGTDEAAKWRPAQVDAIDWGAPFHEVLRAWMAARGLTRQAAANLLGVSLSAFDVWYYQKDGKTCPHPAAFKALMRWGPASGT